MHVDRMDDAHGTVANVVNCDAYALADDFSLRIRR